MTGATSSMALARVSETSLGHLAADGWRAESGERLLEELRLTRPSSRWSVLLVDLDGSVAVRAMGRAAKLSVVREVRSRLVDRLRRAGLSPAAVVDTGQRDKTFLVVPELDPAERAALGDALRREVGDAALALPTGVACRLTATVGAVGWSGRTSALELITTARDAVVAGKQRGGDAVVSGESIGPADPSADPLWRGLSMLAEKYGPIWYWVVERGLTDEPTSLPGEHHAPIPAPARHLFAKVVAEVRAEAEGRSVPRVATGVTGGDDPRVQRPWAASVLAGVGDRRGHEPALLVAEAGRLARLHRECWRST